MIGWTVGVLTEVLGDLAASPSREVLLLMALVLVALTLLSPEAVAVLFTTSTCNSNQTWHIHTPCMVRHTLFTSPCKHMHPCHILQGGLMQYLHLSTDAVEQVTDAISEINLQA